MSPGAPELAGKVTALMPATEPVVDRETRGLDHGAIEGFFMRLPKRSFQGK